MKRKLIAPMITFILLAGFHATAGDEAPFCFRHKDTGSMMFDCIQIKGPNDASPSILCRGDFESDYTEFSPKNINDWIRITGHDCLPKPSVKYNPVPKGGDQNCEKSGEK